MNPINPASTNKPANGSAPVSKPAPRTASSLPQKGSGGEGGGGAWKIAFDFAGGYDLHWNARLAETLRSEIAHALNDNPSANQFERRLSPLVTITAQRVSAPDAPLTIHLDDQVLPRLHEAKTSQHGAAAANIPYVSLPDPILTGLRAQLRGVENTLGDIVHDVRLRWEGVEAWSAANGRSLPLPPALVQQLQQSAPVYLAHGLAGTGKTTVLTAAANTFCIETGLPGILFSVDAGSIRSRHIGASAENLRAVFDAVLARPEPVRFILLDEVEIIGARRSIKAAHQEDKSLTVELIHQLDRVAAASPLVVVLMATNQLDALDPAIRRRASLEFAFDRPDAEVRRQLLQEWFAGFPPRECERLVRASRGMTPAALNTTLAAYYRTLLRTGKTVASKEVLDALRRAPRTEAV